MENDLDDYQSNRISLIAMYALFAGGLIFLLCFGNKIYEKNHLVIQEQKIGRTYEPSSLEEGLLRDFRF